MKAQFTLKNADSEDCRHIIVRNLSRILDMRIIDIDTDSRLLTFLYTDRSVLPKIRRELQRIGFPVSRIIGERPNSRELFAGYL